MQQPNHPRNASVNDNNYDKHQDDDVSDISEEDDFLPGEHEHHNVASMKKYRVFWTQAKEEYLLRCYNHYRLTSSSDHGLKGKSWRRIAVRMSAEFNEEYDSKSCRNKMNVLRADYANYKAILEARAQGKDDEEFWNQINNKSARATKWKDQEFPYFETLRRILEENGDGVDPLPYLEIQELPPNAQLGSAIKKRPRESLPATLSPRKRLLDANGGHHEFSGHNAVNEPSAAVAAALPIGANSSSNPPNLLSLDQATEILLQRMKEGFDNLANLIKSYHTLQNIQTAETVKTAMGELNKEKYKNVMENHLHREKIFQHLKDAKTSHDFLLYPEEYRIMFLEDLLNQK